MKKKIPCKTFVKKKSSSDSTEHIEKNPSDNQSLDEVVENSSAEQMSQQKIEEKQSTSNRITEEQFISAVNDLGFGKKELDKETWRLNDFTRSNESVWGSLITKLKLNQTESIRHSLYNFWRRNHKKIEKDISENEMMSIEEKDRSDEKNEVVPSVLNPEIKPLSSNASIPYPQTRFADHHQSNLPPIVEASFILTSKEWKEIYDSMTRKMQPKWTTTIYNRVCSCNFRCILAFRNHHITLENTRKINSSFFHSFAICTSPSCERTFEIFIRDEPIRKESIVVRIRAIGDENHSVEVKACARKLTGQERMNVGKMADTIGCLKVFQQKVEKADEEMLKARNFTGCETMEVIKHALDDYRKQYQLDECIFRECRIRQQLLEDVDVYSAKIKGYVQVTGEKPFRLHLTSEAQVLRYITYCKKNTYSHVHIDATGSIVKSLPHQKIVLLYAVIFRDGNDPTNVIPLSHAILADHTATSISYFLGNIRQHIVTLVDKVIRPSFFVTDFSPAIFNAILQTFNHEDIRGHLKRCWNVMQRKYNAKELHSLSFLRICCCHMMNAFARSLTAAKVAKAIRKKVMHIFALFINCGELEISFKFLKRVLYMFGNPEATDADDILEVFLDAPYDSEDVPDKIGSFDFEVDEDSTDPLDEIDENMHSSKAIIHESPFNIEAIRRSPELSELLDSKKKYENVTNPLFCRRIIYVFYRWFAYLPLWTSLLTDFENRYANDRTPIDIRVYEHGRLSNAQIESYFGILKKSILGKRTNLRPAEVIVTLYRSVKIQLKADKFEVGQMAKNRQGKPTDVNVVEPWKKKGAQKNQRSTHMDKVDKYNKKRLAKKPISAKPKAATRRSTAVITTPRSMSPELKRVSPQTKTVSPKLNLIELDSQQGIFDNFCSATNDTETKTGNILNNIPNASLPHYSLDFFASKPIETFCGTNFSKKQDFLNNIPMVPSLSRSQSPPNIFSAMTVKDSSNVLSNAKQKKTRFNTDAEQQENCEKQQKEQKNETINGISQNRVRQTVIIDQCSLIWPSFGIKSKCFEGRVYSVTNTCNIDSALFPIYFIFRTESNIQNIILNSVEEPFLSLRKTFAYVESDGWDEARLYWLITHHRLTHQQSPQYNAFGSVDANVLRFIKSPLQLHQSKSICSRQNCSTRERIIKSTELSLESWETSIFKFANATDSRCGNLCERSEIPFKEATRLGYKRHRRDIKNIHTNMIENEDGWLCNGEVIAEPSTFIHGPPPFLFVDIVHPTMADPHSKGIVQVDLNFHNIPRDITVGSSV